MLGGCPPPDDGSTVNIVLQLLPPLSTSLVTTQILSATKGQEKNVNKYALPHLTVDTCIVYIHIRWQAVCRLLVQLKHGRALRTALIQEHRCHQNL